MMPAKTIKYIVNKEDFIFVKFIRILEILNREREGSRFKYAILTRNTLRRVYGEAQDQQRREGAEDQRSALEQPASHQ